MRVESKYACFFFFSSRRRHTRLQGDWSSDVCSSDLARFFVSPAFSPLHVLSRRLRPCRSTRPPRSGWRRFVNPQTPILFLPRLVFWTRSEERRVGKEGRSRWSPYHLKKKKSMPMCIS